MGFRLGLILLAVSWFFGTAALAAPKVTESVQTYSVDAKTAFWLKIQMRNRGPKKYWALTRWDIRWTSKCQVTVDVTYTMPEHENPKRMSPELRQRFDDMLARLWAHERQHGQNGINAAREIARTGCRSPEKIIRKYHHMDQDYDKRTNHGKLEGITLD